MTLAPVRSDHSAFDFSGNAARAVQGRKPTRSLTPPSGSKLNFKNNSPTGQILNRALTAVNDHS